MINKVIAILTGYTDVETISEASTLEADLGLTSFDVVSIVAGFEDEFHIEIPDRDIRKFISVKDIVEYLEKRV